MPRLDHNTMTSEFEGNLDMKADLVFKNIALHPMSTKHHVSNTSPGAGNLRASPNHEQHFDLNQKRSLMIKNEIPTSMIKFKNKSEQMRYTRITKCILSLRSKTDEGRTNAKRTKNANDVEFTYMKIFRFLADILSLTEFDSLSYYHVRRFVETIVKINSTGAEDPGYLLKAMQLDASVPMSLRHFACSALDLSYQ